MHAAEEAAYGRALPRDPEELYRVIEQLQLDDAPRDGAAWTAGKHAAYLALTYPVEAVTRWFIDAGTPDPAGAACRIAIDVARACQSFREERNSEGLHWRRGKATGLGNLELRKHLKATGAAAIQLGQMLYGLQMEASRPGQAATERGSRVRWLYRQVVDNLIAELAKAGNLDENDLATLDKLRARIDVDGDHYIGGAAAFETALVRHGRWCQNASRPRAFWENLPDAGVITSPARDRFFHALAECWQNATGTVATCTGQTATSRPSGFMTFLACVHGHFAGLADAKLLDKKRVQDFLSALGMRTVPSAKTVRAILQPMEIPSA